MILTSLHIIISFVYCHFIYVCNKYMLPSFSMFNNYCLCYNDVFWHVWIYRIFWYFDTTYPLVLCKPWWDWRNANKWNETKMLPTTKVTLIFQTIIPGLKICPELCTVIKIVWRNSQKQIQKPALNEWMKESVLPLS